MLLHLYLHLSYSYVSVEVCQTYKVAGWEVSYWILSSERDGAEHDEHQDEVGEYVVIDESVAKHPHPGGGGKERKL